MGELRIVLGDCQRTLLEEIADKAMTQKDIALTYHLALWSGEVDWSIVNRAIVERWSPSGLERVKKMAWEWKDSTDANTDETIKNDD